VDAPPVAPPAATAGTAAPAKKPRFALTRKQLHAAEAAAAAGTVAAVATPTPEPTVPPVSMTMAPPAAPPADPVPLAVQLPPPPPPGTGMPQPSAVVGAPTAPPPTDGTSGASGPGNVVLADSGSKAGRRGLVLLVILLVVVVAAGGYLLTRKNSTTTTATTVPASPATSAAADTVLAGTINLRLADLPAGWTQSPPAQATVRPPVAPAVGQASATNVMASCLDTSYAVVSGLFGSGSLPGQTSLVQSPIFQSAAGTAFEMGSRTTVLSSATQVTPFESLFADPKFVGCYQQYRTALAAAAVPGASVTVQQVTLATPAGVKTYGYVSTYVLPGTGSEVVGDAYILGGRVVTTLQPTTGGAPIPASVFGPAYNAVAARVATAAR
jgi:hypothetical protein